MYFGHRSLPLPQTWLLFQHGVLHLPTCLLGLESIQSLHWTISNAVFFFDYNWGKQNCMLAPATPTISGFTAKEMSQLPTRLRGQWGGTAPFEPPLTRRHPPFKIPPVLIIWSKGRPKKPFLNHFHVLIPDANCTYLECIVMLGTHSKLHSGQMSHICDISPLRINGYVMHL